MAGISLLGWLGATLLLTLPYGQAQEILLAPVLLFVPLAAACVLGTSAGSPFGDLDLTAARSLSSLRFLQLSGLLVCGSLALSLIAVGWELPHAELQLTRNLAGLSGLALLAAHLLGAGLSWTLPLVYVSLVQFAGRNAKGDLASWAWPMQPATDGGSWVAALGLIVCGLALACLSGTRQSRSVAP